MAQSANNFFPSLAIFLGCSYLVACATGSPLAKNMAADQPAKIPQPASVTVTVAPASASLRASSTISFKANVSGTSNSAVTWSVNSTPGGSATVGTIDASGNYTAPSSVPSPNTISVTATSVADETNSSPSAITLLNPTPSLTTISPTSTKAGSFTLNITGSGFVPGAHVLMGSNYLNTTFVSPTRVTASGSSSSTGSFAIAVQNPDPGGSTSSAASFEVSAPPPTTPTQPTQPTQPTSPSSPSSPTGTYTTPPTLSPSFPVVTGGGTQQFTGSPSGGTYSCTSCKGTINATTGVYTAPATITPQQSYAGWQMLPNNHIENTNVNSMPINSSNATWKATFGPLGGSELLSVETPMNYHNSSTPSVAMVFHLSPANNGNFQIIPYPYGQIEGGWLNAEANITSIDHHYFGISTVTGLVEELYQYYPVGAGVSCSTCNSASGLQYSNTSYALPPISTGASGMVEVPLLVRKQEVEEALNGNSPTGTICSPACGTVNHALKMTFDGNLLSKSFIWPATTESGVTGGVMPYGVRWCLSSSFPIANYDNLARIILTELQNYCAFAMDGGTSWAMSLEDTSWTNAEWTAINTINHAVVDFTISAASITSGTSGNIGNVTTTAANGLVVGDVVTVSGATTCTGVNGYWSVTAVSGNTFSFNVGTAGVCTGGTDTGTAASHIQNYFNAIDESSLELSATSGEANANRETVTYTTSGGSASQDVILEGVGLNFTQDTMNVMAGEYPNPIQIGYNLTGTTNTAVTWTMNPTGYGTISSTGAYTPPATLANGTIVPIQVTVTSSANRDVSAGMTLNVCPNQGCYFIGSAAAGTTYTDASGNIWAGGAALPTFNQPGNINFASEYASSSTGTVDKQLFQDAYVAGGNDSHFWVYAPPGVYQVTFNSRAFLPAGNADITFAGQGSTLVSNVDMTANGVGQFGPFTYQTNLTVGSNQFLQFSEFAPNNVPTGSPVPTTTAFFSSVSMVPTGTVVSVSDVLPDGHEVAPLIAIYPVAE
jgi:hypothetical protein